MNPSRSRPVPWCLVAAMVLLLAGCRGATDRGADTAGAGSASSEPSAEPATAWQWQAPTPAYVGMPAADDEAVAATYGTVGLVLLDSGGTVRWTAERVHVRDVAPRLTTGVVLAATEGGVVAFERDTGQVRWDVELGERANTPVVAGGRAVVSTWEGSLMALDLDDGHVVWRAALPGPALGPAATDGTVVVATWEAESGRGAGVVAVDGADGRQQWAVPLEPGGVGGPAVAGGGPDGPVVVVVAGDIAAHGLDLDDGRERWSTETEGAGSPEVPPLVLDGEVLVAHRLGGLALLDAATGRSRWTERSDGVAVRGGPAGAGPDGPFAFPLDDGRVLVAGPGQETGFVGLGGRISGVALAPGGLLVLGTREAATNRLVALSGW